MVVLYVIAGKPRVIFGDLAALLRSDQYSSDGACVYTVDSLSCWMHALIEEGKHGEIRHQALPSHGRGSQTRRRQLGPNVV